MSDYHSVAIVHECEVRFIVGTSVGLHLSNLANVIACVFGVLLAILNNGEQSSNTLTSVYLVTCTQVELLTLHGRHCVIHARPFNWANMGCM